MKPKTMTTAQLKNRLMKNPAFKEEYQKLQPEMQIAKQIIAARSKLNLTQAQLAERIGTGQAAISRLEGMQAKPSLSFLQKVAQALDTNIHLTI